MFRTLLLALGGATVLVVSSIGLAASQTPAPPRVQARQAVIDLAASKLGLTGDELSEALKQARRDLGGQAGIQLGRLVRDEMEVAAGALGLPDVRTLRRELAGSTLTAVAQEHNVDPATVAAAVKADLHGRIDALVASGTLRAERAALAKQHADQKVDALMTREVRPRPEAER